MSDRPDHIACVTRPHATIHSTSSFCGRLRGEWAFTCPEHARASVARNSRLVICPECLPLLPPLVEEAKPCPFCGLRACEYRHVLDENYLVTAYIVCDACTAEGPRVRPDGESDLRERAIQRWNERAGG